MIYLKFLPIKNKYSDKYQLNKILKNLIHKSTNHKKEDLLKMNLLEFCEKVYDKKTARFLSAAFEYVTEEKKSQNTVLAGGRYNQLFASIGGKDISGVGWAAGVERIPSTVVIIFSTR